MRHKYRYTDTTEMKDKHRQSKNEVGTFEPKRGRLDKGGRKVRTQAEKKRRRAKQGREEENRRRRRWLYQIQSCETSDERGVHIDRGGAETEANCRGM